MNSPFKYLEELLFIYPRRLAKYASWIGWRAAAQVIFCQLLRIHRKVRIKIKGHTLVIRTCSSDILVAAENLYYAEYSGIRSENPAVIVDAGANIGSSAIHFAAAYPNARVYALEPQPENFAMLRENTSHLDNVIPIQAALCATADRRTIQGDPDWPWGYTVGEAQSGGGSSGLQEIECLTLDGLMDVHGITRIDILKIDIEGSEKEIFENCTGWLSRVSIISVELHDVMKMGCSRAFYLATRDFGSFEKHGEMIVAYAQPAGKG